MDTKSTTTTEDRCRRCAVAKLVRELTAEILEQRDKVHDLEDQLISLGIHPCTKQNEAVCVPLLFVKKTAKPSKF